MEIVDPRVDPRLMPEGSRPHIYNGPHGNEYRDLPSIRTPAGAVISRWTLTDAERRAIADGEDLFLTVLTFNQRLQPVGLSVGPCDWTEL